MLLWSVVTMCDLDQFKLLPRLRPELVCLFSGWLCPRNSSPTFVLSHSELILRSHSCILVPSKNTISTFFCFVDGRTSFCVLYFCKLCLFTMAIPWPCRVGLETISPVASCISLATRAVFKKFQQDTVVIISGSRAMSSLGEA